MLIIGLTGGIATGKGVVARAWAAQPGVVVIDADEVVHRLYGRGQPLHERVVGAFGKDILDDRGRIDRRRLRALVFTDEAARRRLNALVHPAVREHLHKRARRYRREGVEILVIEAALLLEDEPPPPDRDFFDAFVVTHVDEATQLERLMARDGIGRKEALRMIRAQAPPAQRLQRADYVLDTSGTVEETVRRAQALLKRIRAQLKPKNDGEGSGSPKA